MPARAPHVPAKLAEAAFELFAEQGFARVSLDEVASRAGVTKGSVYHHYRSKREIILASCRFYYRQWQQMTQKQIAPLTDPLDRLIAVLRLSVKTCLIDERNRMFTAEIMALSLLDKDVQCGWAQFYDSARETYVGLVDAVALEAKEGPDDTRRAVNLMLAAMEGIKQRASFEPEISAPEAQEQCIEDLLGILGFSHVASAHNPCSLIS